MSKLSLDNGRVNQKRKTRTTIIQSAKKLMTHKKKVSLEDVAIEASVSRATIYRYFPNVDILMIEASLDLHHLTPDELIHQMGSISLQDSVLFLQKYYNKLAQDHEVLFRRYLSAVLAESTHSKKKIRGSRRKEAMIKATTPFKINKQAQKNLVNIASILMGIDAFITAKDVCGLNTEEAKSTLEWGLSMILKGLESNN